MTEEKKKEKKKDWSWSILVVGYVEKICRDVEKTSAYFKTLSPGLASPHFSLLERGGNLFVHN